MVHFRKQSSAKRGMMPGSAVYVGENPPKPTRAFIHIYDESNYQCHEGFDQALVEAALEEKKTVWIDIFGLQNVEQINHCCNVFGVHPLIVEDIMNTHQRPKVDVINEGLFIVFRMMDKPKEQECEESEQFSIIIKENLLITFRESDDEELVSLYKRLAMENSLIRDQVVDYLAYLLMDQVVDNFFDYVEGIEQSLTAIEDRLIENPQTISLQNLYVIKRRIMLLRKIIAPLRDIVHLLISSKGKLINAEYHMYFRDLHDHCLRLLEAIDLQREMTNNMLEIYLSTLNNRMNETMKILTLFASIFIPLTFIVGVYGMNFDYMPELKWRYAYPMVLCGMAFLAVAMLYFFKKKKLL